MKRDSGGLAVPQAKRHCGGGVQQPELGWFFLNLTQFNLIILSPLGQPFPVPLASLTGVESSNEVWAVYRGRLQRHENGAGPEGRDATVVVSAKKEINALQVHGCFGNCNWKDVVRTKVEDWRPGEEEDEDEEVEEKLTTGGEDKRALEEAESWNDVKDREDEEDFNYENSLHRELHLELCEAFFLAYGLGCLTVKSTEGIDIGLQEMWKTFCTIEEDFPQRYRVFHHYRTEGWVVKSGYKFGADWLLYKLGPAFYHATYMVVVEPVDRETGEVLDDLALTWRDVLGRTRVATAVKKDLLIARVTQWADKRDWDGPHCLHSMAVSALRVRRWVPGEERWMVKPEVPRETAVAHITEESYAACVENRKTTSSTSSTMLAVTGAASCDMEEAVIVLD